MKWWRVVLVVLGATAVSILLAHRADAAGGTDVCGTLPAGQTTWNALGSPYRICDFGVTVPSNAKLVLDGSAGTVQVQAQGSGGILVDGAIATQATSPLAKIMFDGPGSAQSYFWDGVNGEKLSSGQPSTATFDLSYVDIAHSAGLGRIAKSVKFDHVAVHDGADGIDPRSPEISITNSSVSHVQYFGITNTCPTDGSVSPSTIVDSNTVDDAGRSGIAISDCGGPSSHLAVRHNRVSHTGSGYDSPDVPNFAIAVSSLTSTVGPGHDIDDNQGAGNVRDVLQFTGFVSGGFTWITPTNSSSLHPLGYAIRYLEVRGPGTVTIPAQSVVKGPLAVMDGTVDASAPGSVFTSPLDNSVGVALCPVTTPSFCNPGPNQGGGVAISGTGASGTFVDATVRFGDLGFASSGSLFVSGSTISDVGVGLSAGSGGVMGATDLHVDGTHITRTTGTAIAGANLTHATISNVQISDAGQGVGVWVGDGGQLSVTGVSVDAAGRTGIAVEGLPGATVVAQGNRVTNSGHSAQPNQPFRPAPAMSVRGDLALGPGAQVTGNTGSGNALDAIELSGTVTTSFTWISPTNSASDHAFGYLGDSLTLPPGVVMTVPKDSVLKFHSIAAGDIAPSLAVSGGTVDASAGGSIWTAWDDQSAGLVTCFDVPTFACPTTFSWMGIKISADSGTGIKGNAHFAGAAIRHGDLEYTSGAASTVGDSTHGLAVDGSKFDDARVLIRSTGARIDGSRITGHPGDFVDYAVAINDGVGATMTCDTITKNSGGIVIFSVGGTASTALTITDSNIFDNREPPPPAPYLPADIDASELSSPSVPVAARTNWWGQPGGPVPGEINNPAFVDSSSPLDAPSDCAPPILQGTFIPLSPARIVDTRTTSPLGPNMTRDVQATGQGGVPSDGVSAVVVNITATDPTAGSYLTVFPTGTARPLASNLNFRPGQTIPNLVVVKLGAGGKFSVYNAQGSTHFIADVVGWYSDGTTAGARYNAVTPSRLLDTRNSHPVGPNSSVDVQATGQGGVPASGVSAVVVNITATEPTVGSYLTAFPTGTSPPLASNLNFGPGQTIPNLVVVKLGAGGKFSVYNAQGFTHVIADVVGWYSDAGSTNGQRFNALVPARILDTRTSHTPVGPNSGIDVQAAGQGGVPSSGVSAVVVNVTATDPTTGSYLTAYPSGGPVPTASNLNFGPGQTIPNLVVVKLGTGGKFSVYNAQGNTDVIADVIGWYGP